MTRDEAIDLAGWVDDGFESAEERQAAWWAHREEILDESCRPPRVPGHRPGAYWDYEPGAPHLEDFLVDAEDAPEGVRVDTEAHDEAKLRYLARRGELHPDELAKFAEEAHSNSYSPEWHERKRHLLDAVREEMADRQQTIRKEST